MASLTNYKGLQIVTPDPTGQAGLAINNNFKILADMFDAALYSSPNPFQGAPGATGVTGATGADGTVDYSLVIRRDGSQAWTANQSVGGNKLTNLANGTSASDAAAFGQIPVTMVAASSGSAGAV